MKSHKQLIPLFFIVFLIVIMLISSIFSVLPLVKANGQFSQFTINVSLNGVDNNQGTYCYLNGFDIFATDTNILFYNGNGSSLTINYINYIILPTPSSGAGYTHYITRIIQYNNTALLVVTVADYGSGNGSSYTSYFGVFAGLVNTYNGNGFTGVGFTNVTWVSVNNVDAGSLSSGYSEGNFADMILAQVNGQFFALISGIFGYYNGAYNLAYQTALIKIASTGLTEVSDYNNIVSPSDSYIGYNATQLLGSESFWFQSATELNSIYIITKNIEYTAFQIYKLNCVTPTLSLIGYSLQDYNTFVYFVNYNYDAIGINSYYNVLFAYPASSVSTNMNIELIRFNDTYYQTPVNVLVSDSNAVTNFMRPLGCILPSYVNNINSLANGNYIFMYTGQLYRIFTGNITVSGLTTITPVLTVNIAKVDGTVNAFMYFFNGLLWGFNSPLYFANGWWDNTNIYFSTSNNVGGILSPFGYGNMFQVDYQNSIVTADYLISTNPSSGLGLFWVPSPYNSQKLFILPSTVGSFTLSQNVTYTVTGSLAFNGVTSGNGNYTIYSNGENNNAPFANPVFNIPVGLGNGTINNGVFSFNVHLTQNMGLAPIYEVYDITTNLGNGNSTFLLSFTWQFIDAQGNTLPSGDNGLSSGSGNGGGTTGGGGTNLQSLGISNTELAIGIYTICIIGLIIAFYYLNNNNIPFAVGLSLIVATIMCNIMNILGIYTYPIDALIIITIAVVLIYGRH
jgi:hypothetical protein